MNEIEKIIASTFELQRAIKKKMMNMDPAAGVNLHQMHTLRFIDEQPKLTMSKLADTLHISQASATPLIARLQKMGLVQRKTDPKNRKLVRLVLTPKGKEQLKKAFQMCQKQLKEIFSFIPKKDQPVFARILAELLSALPS